MDTLRVTDGAVTCDLAAAPQTLIEYAPRVAAAAGEAGPVDETLKVAFGGQALALALAGRERLLRLLQQAGRVQAGSGESRVYLEWRREAGQPLYRSELLAGSPAGAGDVDGYWPARGQLRCAVRWTRRGWWEAPEQEIALLGPAGDEHLGGMEVIGAYGARGSADYVDLAAIAGDLPAPLRLAFTNEAEGWPVARLYASLRSAPVIPPFIHILEGEAVQSGGATQPPAPADPYSGGYYRELTWSGAAEARLCAWGLAADQLALAAGRWYRLLVRWCPPPAYTDLLVQARVALGGDTVLWQGPWVRPDPEHEGCELGSLAIPPTGGPTVGLRPLALELWARRPAAGDHTVALDYAGLFALDGFRRYDALGFGSGSAGLDQGCSLVDDGPTGDLYAFWPDGAINHWLVAGPPLMLRPGYGHRLSLFWEGADGAARADRLARVRLWYRSRVLMP